MGVYFFAFCIYGSLYSRSKWDQSRYAFRNRASIGCICARWCHHRVCTSLSHNPNSVSDWRDFHADGALRICSFDCTTASWISRAFLWPSQSCLSGRHRITRWDTMDGFLSNGPTTRSQLADFRLQTDSHSRPISLNQNRSGKTTSTNDSIPLLLIVFRLTINCQATVTYAPDYPSIRYDQRVASTTERKFLNTCCEFLWNPG